MNYQPYYIDNAAAQTTGENAYLHLAMSHQARRHTEYRAILLSGCAAPELRQNIQAELTSLTVATGVSDLSDTSELIGKVVGMMRKWDGTGIWGAPLNNNMARMV